MKKITFISLFFVLVVRAVGQLPPIFWKSTTQSPTKINGKGNTSIAISKISDAIFVGTVNDGIYKSSDNGELWINVLPLKDTTVEKIVSKDGNLFAIASNVVFKSTDDGSTWQRKTINTEYNLTDIEILTSGRVLVSTASIRQVNPDEYNYIGDGIFMSDDGGLSWFQSNTGIGNNKAITNLATNDDVLVASMSSFDGIGGGILYSLDYGLTWIRLNLGAFLTPMGSITLTNVYDVFALEFGTSDTLYFSYEGASVNFAIAGGLKGSLNDIIAGAEWQNYKVSPFGYDWYSKPFYSLYFSDKTPHIYSSLHTPNSMVQGGAYFKIQGSEKFKTAKSGIYPVNASYFKVNYAENSHGKIFAVHFTDHRVYYTDTSTVKTDIKDHSPESLMVFPNPVSTELKIMVADGEVLILRLTNSYGETLLLLENPTKSEISIPVEEFSDGVYFLQIHSSESTHTMRVIIQH